jgi:hypothetical protein
MLIFFISIFISFLMCIKYIKSINKDFFIYFIFLSIIIYFVINNIYYTNSRKIYENLDMMNKENTDNSNSFSIPGINLNDYGDININIGQNSQKTTNKIINEKYILNDDNNTINDINDDINNYIIPKKFNKKPIYGQYAWTNNPDFYIPDVDGIY